MKKLKILWDNSGDTFIQTITEDEYNTIKDYIEKYSDLNKKHQKKSIEELLESFINLFNINLLSIITYGDTNTISTGILNKVIDKRDITINGVDKYETVRAHRCYHIKHNQNKLHERLSIEGFTTMNTVIHEDMMGSWKCILNEIDNPEYVMIYKIEKDGKEK